MRRRWLILVATVVLICGCCSWAFAADSAASGSATSAAASGSAVSVAGSASAESSAESATSASAADSASLTATDIAVLSGQDKLAAATTYYAPEVITLEDGTEVQRTPADPFNWNTAILNGDNRGCLADGCHTDLLATTQLLPMTHPELWNPYGIEPSIRFCYMCHSKALFFQDSMHAIHSSSESFTGDCNSCHYISPATGAYEMWDLVKYNEAYMGITPVPNVAGDFTFTQDSVTPADQLFYYWENGDHRGITPDNDTDPAIYENWEISVTGLVSNPITFKISDYEDQMVTKVAKMDCQTNPPGGAYIANVEVTGLPLSVILNQVGVDPAANAMSPTSDDGWCYPVPMSFVTANADSILIVTKINGEPLDMMSGYPVQLWYSTLGGTHNTKRLATLDFSTKDAEPRLLAGFTNPKTGTMFNKPNTGIFNSINGKVFTSGSPIAFEGYADAYDVAVTGVEISFDKGATWTHFDLGTTDVTKWVDWTFTFTPPAPGSYLMMVRGVAADGSVSTDPSQMFFVVK